MKANVRLITQTRIHWMYLEVKLGHGGWQKNSVHQKGTRALHHPKMRRWLFTVLRKYFDEFLGTIIISFNWNSQWANDPLWSLGITSARPTWLYVGSPMDWGLGTTKFFTHFMCSDKFMRIAIRKLHVKDTTKLLIFFYRKNYLSNAI